jgi:hypothetical protein
MSLATFKKKSKVNSGSSRSGRGEGGYWVSRGPFGNTSITNKMELGYKGFSINGGMRNSGGVGKTYKFSTNNTRYKGVNAVGYGGCCGKYYTGEASRNVDNVWTRGDQYKFIKPSVLSNKGMLATNYRWIRRGQPHTTVQPSGANITDVLNSTQGMYIERLGIVNNNYTNKRGEVGVRSNCLNPVETQKYSKSPINCPDVSSERCGGIKEYSEGYVFNNEDLCNVFTVSKRAYINTSKSVNPVDTSEYTKRIQKGCYNSVIEPGKVNGDMLDAKNTNISPIVVASLEKVYVNSVNTC